MITQPTVKPTASTTDMRPELAFTSAAECGLIVEQALAVPEDTGVARLPAGLVKRTVARLPRIARLDAIAAGAEASSAAGRAGDAQ